MGCAGCPHFCLADYESGDSHNALLRFDSSLGAEETANRKETRNDFSLSGLAWVLGDAEELPFDDDKFDVYTIAFGIRNVTHIDQVCMAASLAW